MRPERTRPRTSALAARLTILASLTLAGCGADDENVNPGQPATPRAEAVQRAQGVTTLGSAATGTAAAAPTAPAPVAADAEDPLRNRDDLPPEQRVLIVAEGRERYVDEATARAHGYTVVDFRNDWTPYIFEPVTGPDGLPLENRYRRIFIGLANDETDGDGVALPAHEDNFLEVFGIPPSMGVIRERVVTDATRKCHEKIDYPLIAKLDAITYRSNKRERRHQAKVRALSAKLDKAMKQAKAKDLEALKVADPSLAADVDYVEAARLEVAVMGEIDKRLDCDRHNDKRYRHKKGQLDHGLRLALRRFQRKHKLYENTNLRHETMRVMAQPPLRTNYDGFVRVLTERLIAATSILEDGTATVDGKPVTYTGKDGQPHALRNLVQEFTDAALASLDLATPEKALAFFQRHPAEDFGWLRVGVKVPPLPEYYAPHMELDVVVDRGDVWYDPPWDEEGKRVHQSRARMPKLYLYVTHNGERFPLVRWPTTIGGWREEQAINGYEYYKYKGSDVGSRVIRKIISGPTWVPPGTTPLRSLAKRKYVNGKAQGVVNYEEMGPGYLSAYGLVAGYFVIPGKDGRPDQDRGIRAHGSSDFMSIRSAQRFSHGCHRLVNHAAVRLYGFLLHHRTMVVDGDQELNANRQFFYKDQVYAVRIPSRGFQYRLEPPLPVEVLGGRIRGTLRQPVEGLVKMPGKAYPAGMPGDKVDGDGEDEDRSGGGSAADEDDT